MFRPFGTGTDDGHVALQDVEDLRHLVEPDGPDDLADGRDAVVIGDGRVSLAVGLGVRDHRAELDDVEDLAVLRDTGLLVEDRAPVVGLDEDGRDEHERARDDEGDEAQEDVDDPLEDLLLEGETGVAAEQQRRVEHVQVLAGADDDVGDFRRHVGAFAVVVAVLQDVVAQGAGDVADDSAVVGHDAFLDVVIPLIDVDRLADDEPVVPRGHLPHEARRRMVTVDDDEVVRRVQFAVDDGGKVGPDEDDAHLHEEEDEDRSHSDHLPGNEAHDGIHDGVDQQGRDALGVDDVRDPVEVDLQSTVHTRQHVLQHEVQREDEVVASPEECPDDADIDVVHPGVSERHGQ